MLDEAFRHVPAYAPRSGTGVVNYPDTNTQYAWAVLLAPNLNVQGAAGDPTAAGGSYPQLFDFHSVAPKPLAPAMDTTTPPSRRSTGRRWRAR